ncbi:DNA-deoxyinosine glycosylase [Peptacetobacter sp. AB845]|uniref:DNA-deoxyinosine glycosylase n=1 Tax=Peptacetobacter sp. AB845 TaxID=3388429 RepID=UPI0039C9209F
MIELREKYKKYQKVEHTFEPVYDENSKVLILGSFPSVKSREQNFYYGHPRNRFWQVISSLTETELPTTIEEKKEMLLKNNIAIWDVIKSCVIKGSSDSSIKNVVVNDIAEVVKNSKIDRIFANGDKSFKLYKKYCSYVGIEIEKLPSTSPANAAFSVERLVEEWKIIK